MLVYKTYIYTLTDARFNREELKQEAALPAEELDKMQFRLEIEFLLGISRCFPNSKCLIIAF